MLQHLAEVGGAEPHVELRVGELLVRVGEADLAGQLAGRGRHELHQAAGAGPALGVGVEGALLADDAEDQVGREAVLRRPGADRLLVVERVVELAGLVRHGGLEGTAEGREGVADHQDALAAVSPAGEDERLQGLQGARLGLLPHQLHLGEGEVVEPEVGQQPRARSSAGSTGQGSLAFPAVIAARTAGLPLQAGQGAAAVEVGGVRRGDLAVDLLGALGLAQGVEGARRPVAAAAGARLLGIEGEQLGPVADRAGVVPPAVLLPAAAARGGPRRSCPWDRRGAGGAAPPWRGRTGRPRGSRRRATAGPWPPARGRRRSGPPSPGTAGRGGAVRCRSAAQVGRVRAGRWRRLPRPWRAPRRAPPPAAGRRRRPAAGEQLEGVAAAVGAGEGLGLEQVPLEVAGRQATESRAASALASSFRSSRALARRLSWSGVRTRDQSRVPLGARKISTTWSSEADRGSSARRRRAASRWTSRSPRRLPISQASCSSRAASSPAQLLAARRPGRAPGRAGRRRAPRRSSPP